jgi:DNA-binding response OmpR family regulator
MKILKYRGGKMKHRILVVDDDPQFRKFLGCWLETEGHEVKLADDLATGFLNIAGDPLPDIVLLDIHLATNNGLTLIHWARRQEHLAHIPIVAVTGDASLRGKKSAWDAGCDACLLKPVDFDVLRELLATLRVHSVS